MEKRIQDERRDRIYKVTLAGSVGNIVLTLIKLVAGVLGRSGAMMADALHSLSDLITDAVILVFVRLSSRPRDSRHAYGYGKYETLATVVIGFVLLAVGGGICWGAAGKIWGALHGQPLEAPGKIALIAAIGSVAVKEVLYRMTIRVGRATESKVVVANAWHHRSDAFSSVATSVGIGGAIFLGEKWRILDPLAAVVVGVFILGVAFQLIRGAMEELLEKSLPPEIEREILDIVSSFPQVHRPHNLRTRRIGDRIAIEVHIGLDAEMPVARAHGISSEIEGALLQKFGGNTHVATRIVPAHTV